MSANDAGAIVRNILAADATVAAAVGSRIYPEEAPDEADFPLIVYGVRLAEQVDGTAPIWPARVDVHIYSHVDDQAQSVAVAADAALAGLGGYSNGTWLRGLVLDQWEEARDFTENMWGRLLTYSGMVLRS